MSERKVVLYISMSLDGFIATPDDDLAWLSIVEKEGLDYGYSAMLERSDTYIVGRRTYEVVKGLMGGEFPQAKMFDCYVLSRETHEPENGVTFYSGDITELISGLKKKKGKDIYCDGGGLTVKLLMERNLVDEYIISVIPVILGDGIRLFRGGIPHISLELMKSEIFETGLVQLRYKRIDSH